MRKRIFFFTLLVIIAVLLRVVAWNTQLVENLYATGIYPPVAAAMRWLFGWIPFSIGDLLYGTVTLYGLYKLFKKRKSLLAYRQYLPAIKKNWLKWVNIALTVYILFHIFWGLNYDRADIGYQLGFQRAAYDKEALVQLNYRLQEMVNKSKSILLDNTTGSIGTNSRDLFRQADEYYQAAAKDYIFLRPANRSIKKSLYGWLGNYLGFSGYYNPFTGEAQVNTEIPLFLQPFVCCHEIAHQLGYAKENEANFVGYLVATGYGDSHFQYAAYLDLFLYANRNLYGTDSSLARSMRKDLLPAVKNDLEQLRKFYAAFENPVEPYITWAYGKFLQANNQPSGMLSYNEVVADLIAYQKKYGTLSGKKTTINTLLNQAE